MRTTPASPDQDLYFNLLVLVLKVRMSGNIPAIISELTVSDTLVNYFKKGPTVYVGRGDQLFIEAGVSNVSLNSTN